MALPDPFGLWFHNLPRALWVWSARYDLWIIFGSAHPRWGLLWLPGQQSSEEVPAASLAVGSASWAFGAVLLLWGHSPSCFHVCLCTRYKGYLLFPFMVLHGSIHCKNIIL